MNFRRNHSPTIAAAKAGFSASAAYGFEKDPRLPSQKKEPGTNPLRPLRLLNRNDGFGSMLSKKGLRDGLTKTTCALCIASLTKKRPEATLGTMRLLDLRIEANSR